MGNRFDFELAGKDAASDVLKQVSDRVGELDSRLDETREKLKLGGQPSQSAVDGLNTRFEKLSRHARDNVQYIGDMVPPLKNVTELATRYGAVAMRLGGIGAAGYGIGKGVQALNKAAQEAYDLNVAAKNAGLSVEDFTRISGAMQILGADADAANQSVEGLYKGLNDALQNRDSGALGLLTQVGVHLEKTKDGTVDVKRALEDLTRIFPTLAPQTQKTLADMLGFTDADLRLLREGAHYKALLAKSDHYGLTVDPEVIRNLTDVNQAVNEISASWEGLKKKTEQKIFGSLLSGGSVKDGLEGVADLLSNGDLTGLSHALGFISSRDAGKLRKIQGNKALYNSLTRSERGTVDAGFMTDAVRKRYESWYGPVDRATQLSSDLAGALFSRGGEEGITQPGIPYNEPVTRNTPGMRNNNPGNLTAAPNSPGKNGRFNVFRTERDGIAAFFRQMMLDGDRGAPTLRQEIRKYAPENENPTEAYITEVSRTTGIGPDTPLNLHDRQTLLRIAPAMFRFENGFQPFSPQQINQGYTDAVVDPRWEGGRDGEFLQKQREMLVAGNAPESQTDSQAIAQAVADGVGKAMNGARLHVEVENAGTGERTIGRPGAGRITTAMNQY
ncbi:hypothetical protein G6S35_003132 [Salmonella enterica]|nr:hypothetical protein [Salmonella enterica]